MESNDLAAKFAMAVLDVCNRSQTECRYNPTAFRAMVHEHHAVEAARRVVTNPKLPSGFATLQMKGRLDLSIEALVLQAPWCTLFAWDVLFKARDTLRRAEYSDLACPCLDGAEGAPR